jgi:hypothetical protein
MDWNYAALYRVHGWMLRSWKRNLLFRKMSSKTLRFSRLGTLLHILSLLSTLKINQTCHLFIQNCDKLAEYFSMHDTN